MDTQPTPVRFSLLRTLKLGTFHIGSAFLDLLTSGVLNRVLISDLGLMATPVALLSALRYLLAPLGIWAGYRSDTRPIGGLHRLPYIWLGRLPMLLSLPLLPVLTVLLAADPRAPLGWFLAVLAFVVYGVGTLISGGTFLALVRDSAPPARSGLAMGIVQIFLVVSFPVAGIVYSRMMPTYEPTTFWQITLAGMVIALICFSFALAGSERRDQHIVADAPGPQLPFSLLLQEMWEDRQTRLFFLFLALGAMSAFAQDAVLEPFGGQVFELTAGETTRFNTYWGTGVLLSLIATAVFTGRRAAYQQTGTTVLGLALTAMPLALLGYVALTRSEDLLVPVLFLFGLGFGIYTIGAIALLAAMTAERRAGAYLGLWAVAQLLFRGIGIFLGGAIRDVVLLASGSLTLAYASVFFLEALGLLGCIWLLLQVDVPGFARRHGVTPTPAATLAAVD